MLCLTCEVARAQVVTEFSNGITGGAQPFGITAGPDGNLWFCERAIGRIARITPLGVVTEFSTGIAAGAQPIDITTGPDGNLWFAQSNALSIGQITTAGVVTMFSTGVSGISLGIAAAPTAIFGSPKPPDESAGLQPPEPSPSSPPASLPAQSPMASRRVRWQSVVHEANGNRIGRITQPVTSPNSAQASRPVRTLNTSPPVPMAIFGSRSFLATASDALPRVASVTEFSTGITGQGLYVVAQGPDGNLCSRRTSAMPLSDYAGRCCQRVQRRHHG